MKPLPREDDSLVSPVSPVSPVNPCKKPNSEKKEVNEIIPLKDSDQSIDIKEACNKRDNGTAGQQRP